MSKGKLSFTLFATVCVLAGWGCKHQATPVSDKNVDAGSVAGQCEKAEQPFACVLDQAMAARDPNICAAAGEVKRVTCLEAYAEILSEPVACAAVKDPKFKFDCLQAQSSATAPEPATTSTAPSNPMENADGLKIDSR